MTPEDIKSIVEIAIPVLGAIGMWFTYRERLRVLGERSENHEERLDKDQEQSLARHEDNQRRLSSIELQIARDCVKIGDFQRLEDRLSDKIVQLEHSVNNATAKAVGQIREMLRDLLPSRQRRNPGE